MQFTTVAAALLASAATTYALPASNVKSMAAGSDTWTMENFLRTCLSDGSKCTYSYGINTNDGSAATACKYDVTGNPAYRASYQNVQCGDFTIGSTWSGQFGEGKGFQTLSVVRGKQIIYPAYTDDQLNPGTVVKPDQSYPVQNLP